MSEKPRIYDLVCRLHDIGLKLNDYEDVFMDHHNWTSEEMSYPEGIIYAMETTNKRIILLMESIAGLCLLKNELKNAKIILHEEIKLFEIYHSKSDPKPLDSRDMSSWNSRMEKSFGILYDHNSSSIKLQINTSQNLINIMREELKHVRGFNYFLGNALKRVSRKKRPDHGVHPEQSEIKPYAVNINSCARYTPNGPKMIGFDWSMA